MDELGTLEETTLLASQLVTLELNGDIIELRDSLEDVSGFETCESGVIVDSAATDEILILAGATLLASEMVMLELNLGIN